MSDTKTPSAEAMEAARDLAVGFGFDPERAELSCVGVYLDAFAAAAVLAEREACAKLVSTWPIDAGVHRAGGAPEYNEGMDWGCRFAAKAIRARGTP